MQGFIKFWSNLPMLGKIYWILAIVSTTLFIIFFILSLLGHDSDADFDVDAPDSDFTTFEGIGGFILNFKSILSFLMMFSWTGIISMQLKISLFLNLLFSLIAGLIALFVIAFVLYSLSQLTYDGTLKIENTIGKIATVYIKIPAKKQGKGKVEIILNNGVHILDAMTEEPEDIPYKSKVLVIDILPDDVLLVQKTSI